MYIDIHIYIYVCMSKEIYIHVNVFLIYSKHFHACMYISIYIHRDIYIYISVCVHVLPTRVIACVGIYI